MTEDDYLFAEGSEAWAVDENGASPAEPARNVPSNPSHPDEEEEPPEPEGRPLTYEVEEKLGNQPYWRHPVPPDIAAIWCVSTPDEVTCRILLEAWGEERFRSSLIHQAAIDDLARTSAKAEATQQFKSERVKKGR